MAFVKHFKDLRVYMQGFETASPGAWCGPSQLRESCPNYTSHTPTPTYFDSLPHPTDGEFQCTS